MRSGKLLVFSGLDGAGKSTQIKFMMEQLQAEGHQPIYVWTRGGYTSWFKAMKAGLCRLSWGRVVPPSGSGPQRTRAFSKPGTRRLWLRLALLDLIRVYGVQIRWWLWRGKVVVCDRYLGDSRIDFRLNFPQEDVEHWRLWRLLDRVTPRPDAAFLLLVPVVEAVRRLAIKGGDFQDSPEVLAERLVHYQALAQSGPWYMCDGQSEIDELAGQIRDIVSTLDQAKSSLPT